MIFSFTYIFLAILGLSFLIFFHELGHYFVARLVGMRVEIFSIGFGTPIISWMHKGTKWQIGWLPFGGFVKIAGTEVKKGEDPYAIKDGFFGRGPFARILVAAAGPAANFLLAILFFTAIWASGGREKNFSDLTRHIGWVDTQAEIYQDKGIRPGDTVTKYDGQLFKSAKDHLFAPMTHPDSLKIEGDRINYLTGEKVEYKIRVTPYPHPFAGNKEVLTTGILGPARYIIHGEGKALPDGSPLENSGLLPGDRIVWVDGEWIFSIPQLLEILNDDQVFVLIERDGKKIHQRVPRVRLRDVKLTSELTDEMSDWQFEAKIKGKQRDLFILPYNLTPEAVVEESLALIDREQSVETHLEFGDRILAVDGVPIQYAYQLLYQLQQRRVHVIVQRDPALKEVIDWTEADRAFVNGIDPKELQILTSSIGQDQPRHRAGNLLLLDPVTPVIRKELLQGKEMQAHEETKKQLASMEDSEQKTQALQMVEEQENQYVIGLSGIQDRSILFNPTPLELFDRVYTEIWDTLEALFTGSLNPKWMSGPVGIVQVVQSQWMLSFGEALFWLGAISLNLAVLNLLPIPILDGGTILFSTFELITRRRIHPKTLERLIVPFAIFLILFFVYVTFNDLFRIFGKFL